jgi:hemerythrin HHE cation binding domain-containing protein
VDSAISQRTSDALVRTGPAVPDAGISEIGELIRADHARILRLFGALDDLIRRGEPGVAHFALGQIWTRLASLLDVHTRAEEDVCFPLVFASDTAAPGLMEAAAAEHRGLREAVAQARQLEVGSSRWWQVITTAREACTAHFASEERGPLSQVCSSLPAKKDKALARQWAAFVATHEPGTR